MLLKWRFESSRMMQWCWRFDHHSIEVKSRSEQLFWRTLRITSVAERSVWSKVHHCVNDTDQLWSNYMVRACRCAISALKVYSVQLTVYSWHCTVDIVQLTGELVCSLDFWLSSQRNLCVDSLFCALNEIRKRVSLSCWYLWQHNITHHTPHTTHHTNNKEKKQIDQYLHLVAYQPHRHEQQQNKSFVQTLWPNLWTSGSRVLSNVANGPER